MRRRSAVAEIKSPDHEEWIPPVTILDAQGRVVQVMPAPEFRRRTLARAELPQPQRHALKA
jgi:hypothetical protein